ncbi:MAG: hypothetical protein ACK53L_17515, partial [Pirellulaceae bacterium]
MLAELGVKPYHYYWVKALLKFQAAIVHSNNSLLADVSRADAMLACDTLPNGQRCTDCWSAELALALRSIGEAAGMPKEGLGWAERVAQGLPIASRNAVMDATLEAYDRLAWQECT